MLKQNYGITLNQYNFLLEKQRGLCSICFKKELGKKLAVDHCHKSKKIRGLLCQNCNIGIGVFKDDTLLLRSAIEYLSKNNDGRA